MRKLLHSLVAIALVLVCSSGPPFARAGAHLESAQYERPEKLTRALALRIVEPYLAQYPPVIRLRLRRPLSGNPPAYSDLVRAGLLRTLVPNIAEDRGPSFDLTEKARHEISIGYFSGVALKNAGSALDIPLGVFRIIPGSAILSTLENGRAAVRFSVRMLANENAVKLLRLGPARDWVIDHSLPERRLSS